MKRAKFVASIVACISALTLCLQLQAAPSKSPETIRLIAVDSYSQTALWVRVFIDYYIPEVDRRLAEQGNYQIEWNQAFGGTIAKTKGVLDSLQHDLADIGIITTPYHPDKVPFYNLPYVTPLVTSDIGLVARTMSDLADKYPMVKDGWQSYRIKYLTTAGSIDTYNILMTDDIRSFSDLRGKKIGGVGLNMRYLEGSGAAGVSSGLSDWYNGMATGLLDGIIVWPEAVVAYRLYEVAPYMLDIRFGGMTSKVVVMNERTWLRLPEEVQKILQQTANDYRDELARETERRGNAGRKAFVEKGGTIIEVTPTQRRTWADNMPDLSEVWVRDMERRGFPGREILADYMKRMQDNDQDIVRYWGKE